MPGDIIYSGTPENVGPVVPGDVMTAHIDGMLRHPRESGMTMGPDRLPPLPDASLSPAQKRAAAELATGPRGAVFGPFVPLLRSPDFLSPLQKAGEYLRYKSALPPRLSEFAILIVARRWSQQYEWHVHRPIAERAGVPAEHIRGRGRGPAPRRHGGRRGRRARFPAGAAGQPRA